DLDLVHEPVREERADGAVDLAGREDLLLARPALALDEAARDLPRSVRTLAILDRQREERQRRRRVLHRRRTQDHRLAVLDDARAVRLPGHATGLQDQTTAGELSLDSTHFRLSPFLTHHPAT